MPSYGQTIQLLGPETPLSLSEYKLAVKITEAKAKENEAYAEILFPFVIRDLVFARWVREGRHE